jgi:YggT family protein
MISWASFGMCSTGSPSRSIGPFAASCLTSAVVLILLIILQGPVMAYLYRLGMQTGMA